MLYVAVNITEDFGDGTSDPLGEHPFSGRTMSQIWDQVQTMIYDEWGWGEYACIAYRDHGSPIGKRINLSKPTHLAAHPKKPDPVTEFGESFDDNAVALNPGVHLSPVQDLFAIAAGDTMEPVDHPDVIYDGNKPDDLEEELDLKEKKPGKLNKKAKKERKEAADRKLLGGTGNRKFLP